MNRLTHLDRKGYPKMVDISPKKTTIRRAIAEARVFITKPTLTRIIKSNSPKGDVFSCARLSGIMAAKKTSEIIPLCHPISLDSIALNFSIDRKKSEIVIHSEIKSQGKTGVEMEAMVSAAISALTIYDMCKALDKSITIKEVKLLEKSGGKSGHFIRKSE